MAAITSTAFSFVGTEGVIRDPMALKKLGSKHYAQLVGFLDPPASAVIEAELAYQYDDLHWDQLPGTRIAQAAKSATDHPYRKVIGPWVEITQYVNRAEALVLRLTARVSSGTGNVLLGTVNIESR